MEGGKKMNEHPGKKKKSLGNTRAEEKKNQALGYIKMN